MAKTKLDIRDEGILAFAESVSGEPHNPYKPDSWQANAWSDGWRAGKADTAAEAVQDEAFLAVSGGQLPDYPARMPHATREHIRRLNLDAVRTKDSTRALRLDARIIQLYNRWA